MVRSTTPPNFKRKVGKWIAFEGFSMYGYVSTDDPEVIGIEQKVVGDTDDNIPEWARYTITLEDPADTRALEYSETEQGAWTKAQRIAEDQSEDN